MADCASLARVAAAGHIHDHIELSKRIGERQRLTYHRLQRFQPEIFIDRALIDHNIAFARNQTNARDRLLPSTHCVKQTSAMLRPPPLQLDLVRHGLLGLVRVLRASVHMQLLQHLIAERILRSMPRTASFRRKSLFFAIILRYETSFRPPG